MASKRALVLFVTAGPRLNLHSLIHHLSSGGISRVVFVVDEFNEPHRQWGQTTIAELRRLSSGASAQALKYDEVLELNPRNYENVFRGLYDLTSRLTREGFGKVIDITSATAVAAAAATHVAILVGAELSLVQAKEHLEIPEAEWSESYKKRADQEGEKLIEIPLPHPFKNIEGGLRPEKEGMELLVHLAGMGGFAESLTQLLKLAKKKTDPGTRARYYYFLTKLEQAALVRLLKVGREVNISITNVGRALAESQRGKFAKP
jgi:hypothetical protein